MDELELLKSEDEQTRRKGLTLLMDLNENSPQDLIPHTSQLFDILSTNDDDYVALQISIFIEHLAELYPTFVSDNSTRILESINELNKRNLDDDSSLFTLIAVKMLTLIQNLLATDEEFQKQAIPILLKIMARKSSIKWSAYNPISAALLTKPQILQGNTAALLEIGKDLPIVLATLSNLYPFDKEVFNSNAQTADWSCIMCNPPQL